MVFEDLDEPCYYPKTFLHRYTIRKNLNTFQILHIASSINGKHMAFTAIETT